MTIATTDSKIQYNGNGVTLAFAFPYRFLQNADLDVVLISSTGIQTTQVLDTDYTVVGAGLDAGGTVTMAVAPASGARLLIRREVPLTQETDYVPGDAFPAESHERALDKLTMAAQQLQEQVARSVILPVDNNTFDPELPAIVADRYLRTNNAGTAFELVDIVEPGELVVSPFIETLLDDTTAEDARTTLGAAESGANDDITSLAGLTTPLSRGQGGTGAVYTTNASLFDGIKQAASTTATGVVELATDAEAQAGTDATRAVTPDNLGATILGLGQTWQDLTASRVAGTLYTNSTGRVIKFHVTGVITASLGATNFFEVNGLVVGNIAGNGATANQHFGQGFEVPPGNTYRVLSVAGTSISRWSELR